MSKRTVTLMRSLLVLCAILLVTPIQEVKSASPSLFYTLLPLNQGQKDCLNGAYRAVAAEVTGSIIQRADDVAFVNNDYNLVVHCRRTGDKQSFVTIIVTHQSNFNGAKGLALNIQHRMETGQLE
jgi:hypothetical protein